jgi:hypothetical protein
VFKPSSERRKTSSEPQFLAFKIILNLKLAENFAEVFHDVIAL